MKPQIICTNSVLNFDSKHPMKGTRQTETKPCEWKPREARDNRPWTRRKTRNLRKSAEQAEEAREGVRDSDTRIGEPDLMDTRLL